MVKLSDEEFAQMRERALTELKEIAIGRTTSPELVDNRISFCREFKEIEVIREPNHRIKITVEPSGKLCVGFTENNAKWLQNNINVLKKLVDEIVNSEGNIGIDKEKIKETRLALQEIEMYIYMLFPLANS